MNQNGLILFPIDGNYHNNDLSGNKMKQKIIKLETVQQIEIK